MIPGDPAPTAHELIARYSVGVSTARRTLTLLEEWGHVIPDQHAGPRIAAITKLPTDTELTARPLLVRGPSSTSYWKLTVRSTDGLRLPPRLVRGSLDDPDSFRAHLIAIVRTELDVSGAQTTWISQYEAEVRRPDASDCDAILRWPN